MSPKNIFICYRRDDAEGYAGRLYDRLNSRFPRRVFMDVTGISPGSDFTRVIQERVGSCHLLIAVIGKNWLTMVDSSNRRRLDLPDDYVRHEIAAALGRNIPVIPVLVRNAEMPARESLPADLVPLATRNALEVTDTDFDGDVRVLIAALEYQLGEPGITQQVQPPPRKSWTTCIVISIVALLLLGGIFLLIVLGAFASLQSNGGVNHNTATEPISSSAPSREPVIVPPVAAANRFPVGRWRLQIAAIDGSQNAFDVDILDNGTYQSSSGHSGDYSYSGGTLELQNWGALAFQSQGPNGYTGSGVLNGLPFSIALVPR